MVKEETTLLQQTSLDGISMWSRWQPDRTLFFNSFFLRGPQNVIVDPLALGERDVEAIREQGGAQWIIVTTRDHERESGILAEELHAKVAAPALDAAEMKIAIDRELHDGETLGRARVVALDGMKSPGEFGLYIADCSTVIVGDALWGDPPGSLRMVPDQKLGDPHRAALSVRRLWELQPRNILVGDGHCIYGNATEQIAVYLTSRGVPVERTIT
jgi:glyoxylase-like metal-dependent hydrolase (beta-lactamase superfamily II)